MSAVAPPRATRRTSSAATAGSTRVLFRRAVILLLMTLVLPGSAQLVAGNKRWGRVALRTVGALFLAGMLLVLLGAVWPTALSAMVFSPVVLTVFRVGLATCALGWAVLFFDAWRIGDPLALMRRQRLAVFSLNGMLCIIASGSLLFASHLVSVHRGVIVDMFGNGVVSATEAGRYNVLLLGGDAGENRDGLRPDSITVASIDETTGRTVLLSLPRNLENVPFPEGTALAGEFPDGFDCRGCYLNSVYTWASDHPKLFPRHIDDVGAYATKQAVEAATGLSINYYVMVDLRGFTDLVDAVGGVTLMVPERLPIGGVGGPIKGWIKRGQQHLDGFETLWFARSRATSDDYSRMARQKCVMSAMLNQLSPSRVLTHFQEIADAGKRVVTTDIPASELNTFLHLAGEAKRLPVASVSFVPPKVETWDPDFDAVRSMVDKAVTKAETADDRDSDSAGPGRAKRSAPEREARKEAAAEHKLANQSADVSRACG